MLNSCHMTRCPEGTWSTTPRAGTPRREVLSRVNETLEQIATHFWRDPLKPRLGSKLFKSWFKRVRSVGPQMSKMRSYWMEYLEFLPQDQVFGGKSQREVLSRGVSALTNSCYARKRIFLELITSDRKLKATREGSQ